VQNIIKDELKAVREEFTTPRRTEIREQDFEVEDEDLIQREDMVVTVSHAGYIKRVPLSAYRAQRRGGKGRAGMQTREEDFVTKIFVANTHTPVLFFSSSGMVYREKVWRLPVGNPQARGKALINLLPLDPDERITTIMPMPEDEARWGKLQIMFATSSGNVRRNQLSDFVDIRRTGKIAMKLEPGDHLAGVEICSESDNVLLTTAQGQAIRFAVDDVRVFKGRDSAGVRGIKLGDNDRVISMAILNHVEADAEERAGYLKMRRAMRGDDVENGGDEPEEGAAVAKVLNGERFSEMAAREQFILTVSANGYGKRSSSYEYRLTGRGGKGIVGMIVNKRNGELVASFPVKESDEIMLVSDGGQLIRCPVHDIRIAGRSTQGVTIFDTAEDEHVVSVEHIPEEAESSPQPSVPATG
jgi:DNA gyrase subunit A